MSFTVLVSFQAKPGQAPTLMGLLKQVQPRIIEAGCRSITLFQDRENANRLIEIEEWDSEQAQQQYVADLMARGTFDDIGGILDGEVGIHILDAVQSARA